jgi:hypothetical protein
MKFHGPLALALWVISIGTGCGKANGTFTVNFPDPSTVAFEAILAKEAQFELNGQVLVPPYGDLYFIPRTAEKGFTFGGRFDLRAFAPDSWSFNEVARLPTGAFFPAFIETVLVQVPVSGELNAYFGARGQKYVGVAWSFIHSATAPIGIGADYLDSKGNRVLSALFYPPVVSAGAVSIPGGLFLATNLTPYLARPLPPRGEKLSLRLYAVEDGRIREFRPDDAQLLKAYQRELEASPFPR